MREGVLKGLWVGGEGGCGGGRRLGKVLDSVNQCRKGRGWAGAGVCRWLPGVTLRQSPPLLGLQCLFMKNEAWPEVAEEPWRLMPPV